MAVVANHAAITAQFAGNIEVPLFETPFFAVGAGAASVCGGRFSAIVAPQSPTGGTTIYRPDVTVLNNTPFLIPVNSATGGPGQGKFYQQTPYYTVSFDRAGSTGHINTVFSQKVPFGVNGTNPSLVTNPTTINPGPDGSSCSGEMMTLQGGVDVLMGNIYDVGILDGWGLILTTPDGTNVGSPGTIIDAFDCGYWPAPQLMIAPIPTYPQTRTDDNNYFLCGDLPTGHHPFNIVQWGNLPQGNLHGTVFQIHFDDPSLEAQLADPALTGPPAMTRSTRYGWLMTALNQRPGSSQLYDIILLSMTGRSYKRIILVGETPRASTFINVNASVGYAAHIDISGLFYAWDYGDNGRFYTSFGLNIPLTAPLIDNLQFAPLPCFSPCYPFFLTPSV